MWLVQAPEADVLNVANVGRAVAAGAEVWCGSVADRTEATSRGHQAADGGAGGLMLHPESGFYRRAGPATQHTSTLMVTFLSFIPLL